jgi:NAD(P)-dependent dehydrogenase (short-subunit alcohol dehydrogenase family)
VVIKGCDEIRGEGTVEQIRAGGHEAQFLAADFSEMSEVGRVADAAAEIDVLVNMAGFAPSARRLTSTRRRRRAVPDQRQGAVLPRRRTR